MPTARRRNKTMYRIAKVTGLALGGALLSAGVTQAKTVTVMGAGVQTCGTWLEHAAKDYRDYRVTDTQWVIGYVAGVNDETPNFGDLLYGIDNNGLTGWLDQYCSAHPLDTLHDAARALVDERAHSVPRQ